MQVSLPPGTVMGIPVQVAGQAHPLRAAPVGDLGTSDPLPAPHTNAEARGGHPSAEDMAWPTQGNSAPQQPLSSAAPQATILAQASHHAVDPQAVMLADAAPGSGMASGGPATGVLPAGIQGREVLSGGMAPGAHLQFMDRVTTPGQPACSVSQPAGVVNGVSLEDAQEPAAITALTAGSPHDRVRLQPFKFVSVVPGGSNMRYGIQ